MKKDQTTSTMDETRSERALTIEDMVAESGGLGVWGGGAARKKLKLVVSGVVVGVCLHKGIVRANSTYLSRLYCYS